MTKFVLRVPNFEAGTERFCVWFFSSKGSQAVNKLVKLGFKLHPLSRFQQIKLFCEIPTENTNHHRPSGLEIIPKNFCRHNSRWKLKSLNMRILLMVLFSGNSHAIWEEFEKFLSVPVGNLKASLKSWEKSFNFFILNLESWWDFHSFLNTYQVLKKIHNHQLVPANLSKENFYSIHGNFMGNFGINLFIWYQTLRGWWLKFSLFSNKILILPRTTK